MPKKEINNVVCISDRSPIPSLAPTATKVAVCARSEDVIKTPATDIEDLPLDANGKVDRWQYAREISESTGENLRPVDGSDELIFDNVPRTDKEIKRLIKELAEIVFYYDQFLPEMQDVRWLNHPPNRHREILAAVGDKLRKRWKLRKSKNPYTDREWNEMVGTLHGLLWTQGHGWNHRNYEDSWLIPMMRACDTSLS